MTYPCEHEGDPGERVVFTEDFPTADGKGRFVPAAIIPAAERPDGDYPFVLITGRQLEHWHTGSMTRRTGVLDTIEPSPVASINPEDLAKLGVDPGDAITVASRRGSVTLSARADDGTPRGAVFIPFCYYEAAANLLTNPVARSIRQDSRVQVLCGSCERGRSDQRERRLRRLRPRGTSRTRHAGEALAARQSAAQPDVIGRKSREPLGIRQNALGGIR